MKVLIACTTLAKNAYFGLSSSIFIPTTAEAGIFPLLGLQGGGEVAERLELRVNLDSLLIINFLAADLSYTDVSEGEAPLRYYLGGGPDLVAAIVPLCGEAWRLGFMPLQALNICLAH